MCIFLFNSLNESKTLDNNDAINLPGKRSYLLLALPCLITELGSKLIFCL